MKKIVSLVLSLFICLGLFTSCSKDENVINVCASTSPHAEILNGYVKDYLKEKGYTLVVKEIDWTTQNDAVANGDYDANYFQHQPYLDTYSGKIKLAFSCKVHYEPLGIYKGNGNVSNISDGKSFVICNDTSNGIRAFELLAAKGVIPASVIPTTTTSTNSDGEEVTSWGCTEAGWNAAKTAYTVGDITITLIAEEVLVSSMKDYDFALLPCNTAYTGNVTADKRVDGETDPAQVVGKANGLAVRVNDYLNDAEYKAKIDVLTDALLSEGCSKFFNEKYLGSMICDSQTQIDLRSSIK